MFSCFMSCNMRCSELYYNIPRAFKSESKLKASKASGQEVDAAEMNGVK